MLFLARQITVLPLLSFLSPSLNFQRTQGLYSILPCVLQLPCCNLQVRRHYHIFFVLSSVFAKNKKDKFQRAIPQVSPFYFTVFFKGISATETFVSVILWTGSKAAVRRHRLLGGKDHNIDFFYFRQVLLNLFFIIFFCMLKIKKISLPLDKKIEAW